MFKTSPQPNQAILADLLAEPIVPMAMNADHVTEHEVMELAGAASSKLGARSKIERDEFVADFNKAITSQKVNEMR